MEASKFIFLFKHYFVSSRTNVFPYIHQNHFQFLQRSPGASIVSRDHFGEKRHLNNMSFLVTEYPFFSNFGQIVCAFIQQILIKIPPQITPGEHKDEHSPCPWGVDRAMGTQTSKQMTQIIYIIKYTTDIKNRSDKGWLCFKVNAG